MGDSLSYLDNFLCDNNPYMTFLLNRFLIVSAALPTTAAPSIRAAVTTLLSNRNDSDKSFMKQQ